MLLTGTTFVRLANPAPMTSLLSYIFSGVLVNAVATYSASASLPTTVWSLSASHPPAEHVSVPVLNTIIVLFCYVWPASTHAKSSRAALWDEQLD